MNTGPNSAVHYDYVAVNPEKKRGSKSGCPRKFEKLALTFLYIDVRDVAYKSEARHSQFAKGTRPVDFVVTVLVRSSRRPLISAWHRK